MKRFFGCRGAIGELSNTNGEYSESSNHKQLEIYGNMCLPETHYQDHFTLKKQDLFTEFPNFNTFIFGLSSSRGKVEGPNTPTEGLSP